MADLGEIVEMLSGAGVAIRDQIGLTGQGLNPVAIGISALVVGAVLAFWGGRLLRAVYVVLFMGLGAAVGVILARHVGVEMLIGLVLGAGVVGLLGYLFYRYWIGLTAGACAMLIVAAVAGVRNLPDVRASLETYQDYRAGMGTDRFELGQAGSIRAYLVGLSAYYWGNRDQHRDLLYRVGLVLGLAYLTGLGIGLILPRFTTIVGTSMLGVASAALGAGVVVSTYWTGAWVAIENEASWLLLGAGVLLLISLVYQARHTRSSLTAAPAPAA